MKLSTGLSLGLLLAGLCAASPGYAEGIPRGSYLNTCDGARVEGDDMIARCRTRGGIEQRSALSDVSRCVGDIANDNGVLRCTYGRPGGVTAGPPPGAVRTADRCDGLHHEARELRERVEREWNPLERSRLEGHLNEVRLQEDRCR
jgi:hypothetical protein